jgi:hypothetical protein
MHEHDERPGNGVGPPVEPSSKPVAIGHRQQQARAARQSGGVPRMDIAQSLQVAPEPRRTFPERWNRPGRHVNAILHGRRCPIWRQADLRWRGGPLKLETFLSCKSSRDLSEIKSEHTESTASNKILPTPRMFAYL